MELWEVEAAALLSQIDQLLITTIVIDNTIINKKNMKITKVVMIIIIIVIFVLTNNIKCPNRVT